MVVIVVVVVVVVVESHQAGLGVESCSTMSSCWTM
jgi:hypothetical protein